jgi:outer membrane protein TolC
LFNKGKNIARLKIAKAQQEEALLNFQQSLLNAGSEVSNALYQFHSSGEKSEQRVHQVEALRQSVQYTQSLMRLGTSTYLEVLTAQQNLLTAQLTQVSDRFEQMQAVINLYQALGGGRDD